MHDSIVPAIESVTKLFLEGPFGSGKTTLAVRRLLWLLQQERVRGSDIIVLVPQRTLGRPYYRALRSPEVPPGPPVEVTTVASLARRSVELYWPLLVEDTGFAHPAREPVFLNLETSQYHMGPLVDNALASGAFEGVRVQRSRVISQILDNLNKAALNGFTIDEAYERLQNSLPSGEHKSASLNALESARQLSHRFRTKCLDHNLVDFSLQITLFNRFILEEEWSRTHLVRSYQHLVFDNVEEDTFTAHRLVEHWLPQLQSALLVADEDGGVRAFLGADPDGVSRLRERCETIHHLVDVHTMSMPMQSVERQAKRLFRLADGAARVAPTDADDTQSRKMSREGSTATSNTSSPLIMPETSFRFYPQMIEWVGSQIQGLIEGQGTPPEQIVVLAPYLSDALKFSLQTQMGERGIPVTTHRPSRPLRTEPAARSLLALAAICHPHWRLSPSRADFSAMLSSGIPAADPVRASLLAGIVYRPRRGTTEMTPFESLVPEMQQRVTYRLGELYDAVREWVYAYRANPETEALDHFWARAFGELLSQPGYAFHDNPDAARVSHQLITAARNFRWTVEPSIGYDTDGADIGEEFYHLVESGAVGALFIGGWAERDDAVLIAPAYTFLMRNRVVQYQFWLDVGSSGWWERLYQPLTHPYVLSRGWPADKIWTDLDEYQARQRNMRRLVLGLMRRARHGIYLGLSQYSESGFEQQGALLTFINRLLSTSTLRSSLQLRQ